MPEFFETELRTGTAQAVESFTPPSADAVRRFSERRWRRRRAGVVALVLMVGGATAGLAGPGFGHSSASAGPTGAATAMATATTSPGGSPSPRGTASSPAGGGKLGVQLTGPDQYVAETANKVQLKIDNPGPARHVMVEFDAPGSKYRYWVEPCDSGAAGACSATAYDANPLKVHAARTSPPAGIVDFDLALPAGTSNYTAWVDPPVDVNAYTVRVLDGTTVIGQTGPQLMYLMNLSVFPELTEASQDSMTLTRGGPAVGFTTEIHDQTNVPYADIASFTTLSCDDGTTAVSVPQDAYTLEWYTGRAWQAVGAPKALGQFSYNLQPGKSTETEFRISVSAAMPSGVTGCQVTQLVSSSIIWTPPYYDRSAPNAQTVVKFTVG